jgi:hypothetical protein
MAAKVNPAFDLNIPDDTSIANGEQFLRGILAEYLQGGPEGAVSPGAFVPRKDMEWHISVYGEARCIPTQLYATLHKSVALARLSAGTIREEKPRVVGVSYTNKTKPHALILRHKDNTVESWYETAQQLAYACEIAYHRKLP